MAKVQSQTARILIGVGLIILGILYFLKEVDIIGEQLNDVIFSLPTMVFVIGLILLVNSRRKSLSYLFMGLGGAGMVIKATGLDYSDFIFPVVLLALGFYIIYRHVEKQRETELGGNGYDDPLRKYNTDKDVLDEMSIFGGNKRIVNSKNFKGGNITIIFGGSEIFLRDCELSDGDNILDLFVIFGGCDLTVPGHWNVKVDVVSLFGGFSSKKYNYRSEEVDENKTLVIKGLVLFGGGEMKVF